MTSSVCWASTTPTASHILVGGVAEVCMYYASLIFRWGPWHRGTWTHGVDDPAAEMDSGHTPWRTIGESLLVQAFLELLVIIPAAAAFIASAHQVRLPQSQRSITCRAPMILSLSMVSISTPMGKSRRDDATTNQLFSFPVWLSAPVFKPYRPVQRPIGGFDLRAKTLPFFRTDSCGL